MGFFSAARRCLSVYGGYGVCAVPESRVPNARSRVDYVVKVGNIERVLVEAMSPSVMAGLHQLPANGISLMWDDSGGLTTKIFTKVSALFPICYNVLTRFLLAGCPIPCTTQTRMVISDKSQPLDSLSSHNP